MLVIAFDLLHETIRASADEMGQGGGEWPPSPARVFSALVSGGGHDPSAPDPTLQVLESAAPPDIYADPASDVLASELQDRFVVVDKNVGRGVQNYPARTAEAVRPGVRLAPRNPLVVYVWADIELDTAQISSLRARAARVGYLGCADSPARVRVFEEMPDFFEGVSAWKPDESASANLPVPYPGFLQALDQQFTGFQAGGFPQRSWIPVPRRGYLDPGLPSVDFSVPTVFWLRLTKPVSGRRVVDITSTLREAVLSKVPDRLATWVLHGHHPGGDSYEQARFLALPEAVFPHSRGLIRGAAVWIPADTDVEVVAAVDAALRGISQLHKGAVLEVGIERFDGVPSPRAVDPRRWIGPSTQWVSVFPVVFERHPHGAPTLVEVARWCAHAGLPQPMAVEVSPVPFVPGAASLHPTEVFRPGKKRWPYAHLKVEFAEPVRGPVVIGRGRQLGLGLMAPTGRGGSV